MDFQYCDYISCWYLILMAFVVKTAKKDAITEEKEFQPKCRIVR